MNTKLVTGAILSVVAFAARADIDVYPNVVGGLTGPQQMTNALAQAAAGETIVVHPGTYDFSGISSYLEQYSWNPDKFYTNHLAVTKAVTVKGQVTGRWSDEVVFKGDSRAIWFVNDVPATFSGITFEGNTVGCVRFASRWAAGDPNHGDGTSLSNCVIRGCAAASGRTAAWGGLLVDCKLEECTGAKYPVASDTRLIGTTVQNNVATGDYLVNNPMGVYDCVFSNNTAQSGAALGFYNQTASMPISNSVFVANAMTASWVTTGIVGIEKSSGKGDVKITDCTFIGNRGTGGTVCMLASDDGFILEHCSFLSNTNTAVRRCGAIVFTEESSTGRPVLNDCLFRANYSANSCAGVNCGLISNTVFEANSTGDEGACSYTRRGQRATFVGCTFVNNVSQKGGSVLVNYSENSGTYSTPGSTVAYDSYFGTNSTPGSAGGVVYTYPNAQMDFFGCTFEKNVCSGGPGGVTYGPAFASNCVFRANSATGGGAMYHLGRAFDCTFEANKSSENGNNWGGGTAADSSLTRCKISGGGLWCCSLANCECVDMSDASGGLFALFGANWATNCLFTTTKASRQSAWGYIYRNTRAATVMDSWAPSRMGSYVNCTFVDIVFSSKYKLICDDYYSTSADFYNTFENCLFQNNTLENGTRCDFAYLTSKATDTYVKLKNCLYGSSAVLDKTEDLGGNVVCDDVKFAKDSTSSRYAQVPRYSPQRSSVAVDKGQTMGWMLNALDLGGTNRVLGAAVDIGCYEYAPSNKGMCIIMR